MQIQKNIQYNQGISRYKLLSATAGVGSIVTTRSGHYILISDIEKWPFIRAANNRIADIMQDTRRSSREWYDSAKNDLPNNVGVELVDDGRFVKFLRSEQQLDQLICLAAIPQLSLNEHFNTINIRDNPVIGRLLARGIRKEGSDLAVSGSHFPKWFRSNRNQLKPYREWLRIWQQSGKDPYFFSPPRDAQDVVRQADGSVRQIRTGRNGASIDECRELTQLNLVLICENGHLSDIPWDRYLRWRTQIWLHQRQDNGEELLENAAPCCDDPDLYWSESTNRSDGYASIFIECRHCRLGTGGQATPKVSLEGINSLKPRCQGHRPWEIRLDDTQDNIPTDINCMDRNGQRSQMIISLATSNNVYFANTFSSLYIPDDLATGVNSDMAFLLDICEQRYGRLTTPGTRSEWASRRINAELLEENNIHPQDTAVFLEQLATHFIGSQNDSTDEDTQDPHELYRWQEYRVLAGDEQIARPGLYIDLVNIPPALTPFFQSIRKIEELKVTSVQFDFTRVRPKERIIGADGRIIPGEGMETFSYQPEEVHILPAVENFGEGIFFKFDRTAIENWQADNSTWLSARMTKFQRSNGAVGLRQRLDNFGVVLPMVHTLSHLMMRELEFSCGYPTSSLKERLYVSDRMCGVLIYTAEGSEGSMGGLIWQARPERLTELIQKAMERGLDCSSDPLCWQSDGQGLFNLNLASCFSCSLVSETACEEGNMGLDRRLLLDEEHGFFSSMIG